MRENESLNGRSCPIVAMIVFTFNPDTYTSSEVDEFSKEVCKLLAKHDTENVHTYYYTSTEVDCVCDAINREGKYVFVRAIKN